MYVEKRVSANIKKAPLKKGPKAPKNVSLFQGSLSSSKKKKVQGKGGNRPRALLVSTQNLCQDSGEGGKSTIKQKGGKRKK